MAGKKKDAKEGSSWTGGIEKYSRQIWLAGLGAYSKISNDGSKLFETLVKDGEKAEKQVKDEVDDQVDSVKASANTAKSRVGDVKDRALGKWGELEEAFDKRLNSAISRLGVPSRNEVRELHSKVDALTRQIEKLTGASASSVASKPAAVRTRPAANGAAGKPATKPRAAAKPAAAKAASAAKPAVKSVVAKPAAAAKTAAKTVTKAPAAKKPAAPRKPAVKKAASSASAAPTPASAPAAGATTPAAPASES
ncbi:phasin family protein [Pseudomonas sp. UBA4194]|uniref:phasin family protein n=1 Tax=Pseudomonas sp. UBA4194 TaxID=1947317 RepID=UPI0025D1BA60|nr:phasin family protein [Pseudomonas sp. UBA4194]